MGLRSIMPTTSSTTQAPAETELATLRRAVSKLTIQLSCLSFRLKRLEQASDRESGKATA